MLHDALSVIPRVTHEGRLQFSKLSSSGVQSMAPNAISKTDIIYLNLLKLSPQVSIVELLSCISTVEDGIMCHENILARNLQKAVSSL